MPLSRTVIVNFGVCTAYGVGHETLWNGLLSGQTALCPCDAVPTPRATTLHVGAVPMPNPDQELSRVLQLLQRLFATTPPHAPPDAALVVATTTGEIDLLERTVTKDPAAPLPGLTTVLPSIRRIAGLTDPGTVISSACASSTAALIYATELIRSDRAEAVLIVAADALSEFVLSGFSSLMALDGGPARPFDRQRAGLSVGEAAGYMVLMSEARARREGVAPQAFLRGGGMTNDANHMTGPSRDGGGLARAITKAMANSECQSGDLAFVAAHGTGTVYNDAMEIKALRSALRQPVPAFSIKGAIGHTMGNAGLTQMVVSLDALRLGRIPPTVGLSNVDDCAKEWVSPKAEPISGTLAMVVNAGFGGVNAALVVETNPQTIREGARTW